MTIRRLTLWTLAVALATPLALADEKDLRDQIVLKDGSTLQGRVIERFNEEGIVLYEGTRSKTIQREDIVSLVTVRDRLRTFLAEHIAGLTAEEEWQRHELALRLELPRMATLQAHQVLLADRSHEGAHEFLGHKQSPDGYRWLADRRWVPEKEYDEFIREWPDRLVLESEHYVLETNTSRLQAVDMLFDLEFAYLQWMEVFGEELRAGEDVLERGVDEHKMTFHVFATKDDKGFKDAFTSAREPLYNPSTDVTTARGNPNLAFTYFELGRGQRPRDFFDIATQQLMYSTLVLSRRSGYLPPSLNVRHAHWVELGMGYWFGRQFAGPPGYASKIEFRPEPRTVALANRIVGSGPLTKVRKEVTNLVGLPYALFYEHSEAEVHRAKARNFFRFLIEIDPPVVYRNKEVGRGRAGLFHYLRDVYVVPTGHSSSSLDKGLGGKVEYLYDDWVRWRFL